MTRRRATARGGCCLGPTSRFHRLGDDFAALNRWSPAIAGSSALAVVDRRLVRDLRRLRSAACGGGLARGRSASTWRRRGLRLRSRTISAATTRSRSAAPRSSAPAGSASRCACSTSSCAIATRRSSPARRRPRCGCPALSLLMGRLRAESLNLVDAELCGADHAGRPGHRFHRRHCQAAWRPASPRSATACRRCAVVDPGRAASTAGSVRAAAPTARKDGLLAGLDWLDSLSLTGLDG